MIEILGVVEDPLAGIARNDLIILADFLKHLWANADLADFADVISRR